MRTPGHVVIAKATPSATTRNAGKGVTSMTLFGLLQTLFDYVISWEYVIAW